MSRDEETQTLLDEPSRFYFEETNEMKLTIFRLENQLKLINRKHDSERSLDIEKLTTFEEHIGQL